MKLLRGDSGTKSRPSLVGNSSEWKALDFDDKKGASEGFRGTGAGAGRNNSGVVVPFAGF